MPADTLQDDASHGSETILLVEDDEAVREVAHRILTDYGYDVISARDADDAFIECENNRKDIHLLLTDIGLMLMDGRELARKLVRIRPSMKVLFVSGNPGNSIGASGGLDAGVDYMSKPLLPQTLAQRVRATLDTPVQDPKV